MAAAGALSHSLRTATFQASTERRFCICTSISGSILSRNVLPHLQRPRRSNLARSALTQVSLHIISAKAIVGSHECMSFESTFVVCPQPVAVQSLASEEVPVGYQR